MGKVKSWKLTTVLFLSANKTETDYEMNIILLVKLNVVQKKVS